MSDSFFDMPAGFTDADLEMAELVERGRAAARGRSRMVRLYLEGELARAAAQCSHGWRYGLGGTAARDAGDPRYGSSGDRCIDCGSWVADFREGSTVLAPCELTPHELTH